MASFVSALLTEPLQVSRRTAFVRRSRSPVDEETLQQNSIRVYHRPCDQRLKLPADAPGSSDSEKKTVCSPFSALVPVSRQHWPSSSAGGGGSSGLRGHLFAGRGQRRTTQCRQVLTSPRSPEPSDDGLPTRPGVYKRRIEATRMSASRSLPRSSQARASEQGRSSHRARRTESTGLAFGDTASFSPKEPWFSCSKARGSKDLYATSSTTRPLRRVRRMGTAPGRDSGACAGGVLLGSRPVTQAAIVAVVHSEVPVQRPSSAGQLPAAEERTQLVANGGMKSRLWWLCAEGLARKP